MNRITEIINTVKTLEGLTEQEKSYIIDCIAQKENNDKSFAKMNDLLFNAKKKVEECLILQENLRSLR